jgi:hypothetical protein
VANRRQVFQIETKKTHELFISNQTIADRRLLNVRTALMQIIANLVIHIHHGETTDYEKEDCKNKSSTVGRSRAFDDGR